MSPGTIKMKFCESLDRFVEIRQFSEEEAEKIFKKMKKTNQTILFFAFLMLPPLIS